MNTQTDNDPRAAQVVALCRDLHDRGYLAAADGNVSYRAGDRLFITPSGVAKAAMAPEDIAEMAFDGAVIAGKPSSERFLHLAIYRHCPGAKAVIHAHPPRAIALTIARPDLRWLPEGAMSELILAAGRVPVVPYARPGTPALADSVVPFLPEHRALILSRHGVICWGEDLEEALYGVERLEHAATILCLALQMGGITELPDEEVQALRELRQQLGDRIR